LDRATAFYLKVDDQLETIVLEEPKFGETFEMVIPSRTKGNFGVV